jgi:hypothetical protein
MVCGLGFAESAQPNLRGVRPVIMRHLAHFPEAHALVHSIAHLRGLQHAQAVAHTAGVQQRLQGDRRADAFAALFRQGSYIINARRLSCRHVLAGEAAGIRDNTQLGQRRRRQIPLPCDRSIAILDYLGALQRAVWQDGRFAIRHEEVSGRYFRSDWR